MRSTLGCGVGLREHGLTPDCLLKLARASVLTPDEELRLTREIRVVYALGDAYRQACALPIPQRLIDLVASHVPSRGRSL